MRKIVAFLLISLFLFSCLNEPVLDFDQVFLSENDLKRCQGTACPEIAIRYLKAKGTENVTQAINRAIESNVIAAVDISEEDHARSFAAITEALQHFVDTYRLHLSEFPDMSAVYHAEVNVEALHKSDNLLSFSVNQYLYTGGAHGLGRVHFLNLDPNTGNELGAADLIKDKPGFLALSEQTFRARYDIPQGTSINENGFWFDNDKFSIPNTIGFNGNEFIMVYNPYEIASYADGSFELRIPYEEARPFLTDGTL